MIERKTIATGGFRFRPHERLLTSGAYRRVRDAGRSVRTQHFRVNFAPNDLGRHRLGLVVQKRFWKEAVTRNRLKRRLREWFRLGKGALGEPFRDFVIIARPGAEALSTHDIVREFGAVTALKGSSRP